MKYHTTTLLAFLFCFLFLPCLAGCQPTSTSQANWTASVTVQATATVLPTIVPSQTSTSSATPAITPSSTQTETSAPTNTDTPTATPTPQLPISFGTALPFPLQPLTQQNITALREIARYGAAPYYTKVITADGSKVFISDGDNIIVYAAGSLQELARFNLRLPANDRALSVSIDGSRFLALTDTALEFWTLDGKKLFSQPYTLGEPQWLSADGTRYTYTSCANPQQDETCLVEVRQTADHAVIASIQGKSLGFSLDGQYLATIFKGWIKVWRVETGELLNQNKPQNRWGARVYFLQRGDYFLISTTEHIEVRDLKSGFAVATLVGFQMYGGAPALTFSIGEQFMATLSQNDPVTLWDMNTWKQVGGLDVLSNNQVLVVGDDGQTTLQTLPQSPQRFILAQNIGFVPGKDVIVSVAETGKSKYINDFQLAMCAIAYSGMDHCQDLPHNGTPVISIQGNIYVTYAQENELRIERYTPDGDATFVSSFPDDYANWYSPRAVSPDERYLFMLSQSAKGKFFIWDMVDNSVFISQNQSFWNTLDSWSFSPDGRYAAIAIFVESGNVINGISLVLFDLQNPNYFYEKKYPYQGSYSGTFALTEATAFSPDGKLTFIRRKMQPAYWEIAAVLPETPETIIETIPLAVPEHCLADPDTKVLQITYSPDGGLVFVALQDGWVLVFDPHTGMLLHEWKAHNDGQMGGPFYSAEYQILATYGQDGTIRLWGVP